MIDDEEGKKGMWTSRKQFKKCAPCPFKVCTFFSPHQKKKGSSQKRHKKNQTKKNCSNIQHHHKKEEDAFPRPRDIFLCVGLSLCLHPP